MSEIPAWQLRLMLAERGAKKDLRPARGIAIAMLSGSVIWGLAGLGIWAWRYLG